MAKRETRNTVTRKRRNHELRYFESALGLNPYLASFLKVAGQIKGLPESEKDALVSMCEVTLRNPLKRSREEIRVSAIKVLVALFPRTLENIKFLLEKNSDASVYEVHFSFFCFLDQVPRLTGAENFAFKVPILIADYLDRVKSETAQAAWMAGDLLGDHWEAETAFSVLSRAAEGANSAAGRLGAIHGLSHLVTRLESSKRKMVMRLLLEISRSDKSRKVRDFAKLALERPKGNPSL